MRETDGQMSFAQNLRDLPAPARRRARGDASEHLISTDLLPSNWRALEGRYGMKGRSERCFTSGLKCCKKQLSETHSGFKRQPGPVEVETQDNKQE